MFNLSAERFVQVFEIVTTKLEKEQIQEIKKMEIQARLNTLSLVSAILDAGKTYQSFLQESGLSDEEKVKSVNQKLAEEEKKRIAEEAIAKAEAIVSNLKKKGGGGRC